MPVGAKAAIVSSELDFPLSHTRPHRPPPCALLNLSGTPLFVVPGAAAILSRGTGMMSVLHIISSICCTLFPPSAGDEYKNHSSWHGSIALPVPEVPKMSVGAICFTYPGSNGGCWVVLVFLRIFFSSEKWVFFAIRN